jgi:hypothetical protein
MTVKAVPCSPARPRSTPGAFRPARDRYPGTMTIAGKAGTDRGGERMCGANFSISPGSTRRRSRSDDRALGWLLQARDQRQDTPTHARAQRTQSVTRPAKLNDIAPEGRLAGCPRATTTSSSQADCRSPAFVQLITHPSAWRPCEPSTLYGSRSCSFYRSTIY